MHNPQAFLPVENFAAPAVQCLVWTAPRFLYLYIKEKQGRDHRMGPSPAVFEIFWLGHSPTKTMLPERVLVWVFSPRSTVKVW